MPDYPHTALQAAAAGELILTANRRLARFLERCYDQRQQEMAMQVWDAPPIFSWQDWLESCLADLGEGWRLLADQQALRLWERVIEEASRDTELELLQLGKTAEKACQAHRLLCEHQLTLEGSFLTDDQRAFRDWRQQFQRLCAAQDWLDRGELPGHVCAALRDGRLPLPPAIRLVGFDQLPPGAQRLQQLCTELGGHCSELSLSGPPPRTMLRVVAADAEQEMLMAARWARRLLDEGATSIGVVVPDLQARRRSIERIFCAQIDPGAAAQLQEEEAAFSLSLGGPLAEQGVIHAACELLSLGRQLPLEQATFLLRTPYLGGAAEEAEPRAQLDRRLRSFRQQQLPLDRLATLAAEDGRLPQLTALCAAMRKLRQQPRALPGAWGAVFAEELKELGWPGDRPLSSVEFQAVKCWREKLLTALASLDAVSHPLGRSAALQLLRRLASELEFQPQSAAGPVLVVGLLEAAGLRFDHLWVMGLSETTLPAAPRPNPFLPYDLQQRHGMPHASAARELAFAEQVIDRLQGAALHLVFSAPAREGDCDLRPSPLLPPAAELGVPELAELRDLVSLQRGCLPELEQLADLQGPPLVGGQGSGGTGILKDQAHCPFRAFVHHRLGGRSFDEASPGLDNLTRGDLAHKILEQLWTLLQDQQALLQLSEAEQRSLLVELADRVVDGYFAQRSRPSAALLQLEKERLERLMYDWLQKVEVNREPFRVVEREQEHLEQIGPLQIRTQVDRIDELADGSRVVVDYKTGSSHKLDDLFCEPLLEPQLPIYAIGGAGEEADGVVFAQLRRGDCRLQGVVREAGLLDRLKTPADFPLAAQRGIVDWPQLLADWRRQLEGLAADFVAGRAEVRPFDTQRSCAYCDLPGICRIQEALSLEGGDEG